MKILTHLFHQEARELVHCTSPARRMCQLLLLLFPSSMQCLEIQIQAKISKSGENELLPWWNLVKGQLF